MASASTAGAFFYNLMEKTQKKERSILNPKGRKGLVEKLVYFVLSTLVFDAAKIIIINGRP